MVFIIMHFRALLLIGFYFPVSQAADLAVADFCKEPASSYEMCTMHLDQVCAQIDTGVRCFTTPCPSYIKKTFSNPCGMCGYTDRDKILKVTRGSCSQPGQLTDGQEKPNPPN